MNRADQIHSLLKKHYPQASISLKYNSPWQLLAATILSAQCTDKRVNTITEKLFKDHPELDDYINMNKETLIKYIRSAGFYNNKAKSILGSAKIISEKFNGKVPDTMKEIIKLPGVARKTANVVVSNAYNNVEGIAVDTHVKRLSRRMDLTRQKNTDKIETDLMDLFAKEKWYSLNYLLIEHGRNICTSRSPNCGECFLDKLCPKKGV